MTTVSIKGHLAKHKADSAFRLKNGRFSTDDGDVSIVIIEPEESRDDCYRFLDYKRLCRSRRTDNILYFLKRASEVTKVTLPLPPGTIFLCKVDKVEMYGNPNTGQILSVVARCHTRNRSFATDHPFMSGCNVLWSSPTGNDSR